MVIVEAAPLFTGSSFTSVRAGASERARTASAGSIGGKLPTFAMLRACFVRM